VRKDALAVDELMGEDDLDWLLASSEDHNDRNPAETLTAI
jgi:hypothetical protein